MFGCLVNSSVYRVLLSGSEKFEASVWPGEERHNAERDVFCAGWKFLKPFWKAHGWRLFILATTAAACTASWHFYLYLYPGKQSHESRCGLVFMGSVKHSHLHDYDSGEKSGYRNLE